LSKLTAFNNHVNVAEDRVRKQNVNWTYTGVTLTVGIGGTYTTISAAISAAVSGDIIQLMDGEYLTSNESGGYLLINSTTKRLLIKGNASDRTAVKIKQNATATFGIRLRLSFEVTFQDLTITGNQSNTILQIDRYNTGGTFSKFKNCIIENNSNVESNCCAISGLSDNCYTEFDNCELSANNIFDSLTVTITAISDSQSNTYTGVILITNSTLFGRLSSYNASANISLYDTTFTQNKSDYIIDIGTDTAVPSNFLSKIDIRNCAFSYINNNYGHCVLLGRGTKNIYFVNNTIYQAVTNNPVSLGIVIKSTPDNLGDVIIDGNYIEAPRPLYIKGGQRNYVRFNTGISNWLGNGGFGFEINNPNNSDGPISSTGNVISNNILTGRIGALGFSDAAGSPSIQTTVQTCFFNRNKYFVVEGDIYINENYGVSTFKFYERTLYWNQDLNSIFI